MECSKAMLALGSIYEKGLADDTNTGFPTLGTTQRKAVAENTQKAFENYDRAAEFEPYALMKLGSFMEQGKYEEGYKGVKNLQYAYGFFYRAT